VFELHASKIHVAHRQTRARGTRAMGLREEFTRSRGRSARGLIASTSISIGWPPTGAVDMMKFLFRAILSGSIAAATYSAVGAHDIYTGVHGKNGQLCCGGNDCAATSFRESAGHFEFLTREQRWIAIPEERIVFLPIPGDPPNDDSHHAHLCYRSATDYDRTGSASSNVFDDIFLYCAFIPPGSI
jgi:hypothetical protein